MKLLGLHGALALALMALGIGSALAGAETTVRCGASLNGETVKLHVNPMNSAMYLIDADDPNFDKADVMIDASREGLIRVVLARFVSDQELPDIKAALAKLSDTEQAALRNHLKPVVAELRIGYDKDGDALFELKQDSFRLTGACRRDQ